MRNTQGLISLGLLLSLPACDGAVLVPDGAGGTGETTTGAAATTTQVSAVASTVVATSTVATVSTGAGMDVSAFCAASCAPRGDMTCFPLAECEMKCLASAGQWASAVKDAFTQCAAEDPLCFLSMDGCILDHVTPFSERVSLHAQGFDDFEGVVVHARVDATNLAADAVVQGGAFTVAWDAGGALETFDTTGPLVLFYLDVDANDVCSAQIDRTVSTFTTWNGDFVNVAYSVTVDPSEPQASFACNAF